MVRPEVLQRKSLFALLYTLDVDLAETARAGRCPTVGGGCIAVTTPVSPAAARPACRKRSPFV